MAEIVSFPAEKAGGRICVDCDDQINPKRLRASPATRRCVRCEKLQEIRIRNAEIGASERGIVIIKG